MRTIKFRVWNTKGGNFYTDDHVKSNLFNFLERTEEPVMLFTGLLDRNGKEIYEGDVLQWDAEHELGTLTHQREVVFAHISFGMNSIIGHRPLTEYQTAAELEVIGNIYENADLLK